MGNEGSRPEDGGRPSFGSQVQAKTKEVAERIQRTLSDNKQGSKTPAPSISEQRARATN